MNWVVHKFGGSSIRDENQFEHVAKLITDTLIEPNETQIAIVLSAIGGVTDQLIELLDLAKQKDENYLSNFEKLKSLHMDRVSSLLADSPNKKSIEAGINTDFNDLSDILRTVRITKSYSSQILDLVSGLGEIWSTNIMAGLLEKLGRTPLWIDSRRIIISETLLTGPSIDWRQSKKNLEKELEEVSKYNLLVIPGFVASTNEGIVTTLKRNGSDLSAAIMAVLLDAESIHIWTDVNGMYSADPRRVPDAVILNDISYLEALELAYFGAEVLHPSTIAPAIEKNISITIHNTFNHEHPGTRIYQLSDDTSNQTLVKGFATVDSIALITIEGAGMIGVPGISKKLFGALSSAEVSVMMISQASSEYSICVAVTEFDGSKAQKAVEKEFAMEISQGHIHAVKLEKNVGILAAIGDQMVHQPGIASIFFSGLSRSRINVRMISQGSSERNISVIIDSNDMTRALRAVHSAFYLSHLTLSVGIIGIGLIGSSLLDQIQNQIEKLKNQYNIDLRINGLANSTSMLLMKQIQLQNWKSEFENQSRKMDIAEFTDFVHTDSIPHSVIIDCTSSESIANMYDQWLKRGIHVITPNKKANSSKFEQYSNLQNYILKGPSTNPLDKTTHYFYETTVGAGLPIISTLKDLIKTGDQIDEIEGVLSGTLSFIFNNLSEIKSFSEVVKIAKREGYTEPDPRDDLSGIDIARKLVILAREIGLKINVEDVKIQSLLPDSLFDDSSVEDFLNKLPEYDSNMAEKVSQASNENKVLRYVGVIRASGECFIELKPYPNNHPFANLRGSENIILFKTMRYKTYPLIVQGPGAGAAVTSAGVFAELLRLADLLGNS
ncbi:MAG: Bifunctional aspartokinase/homoserine dehydrogenase 1 [Candidatus Heimdallarchaeota archaeon LC_2]|nr:MAG: Bifunctional aspartokinase/homoserine dehydrogenase 1 [Candidatus Heimdallarchaeota archaeon LC_2]